MRAAAVMFASFARTDTHATTAIMNAMTNMSPPNIR
jgi:hypothetical protein